MTLGITVFILYNDLRIIISPCFQKNFEKI